MAVKKDQDFRVLIGSEWQLEEADVQQIIKPKEKLVQSE